MAEYVDAFQRAVKNKTTKPKITTPDNTAFGLTASQTPDLTRTEQKMFGATGAPSTTTTPASTPPSTKFKASDGVEFDTEAQRNSYQKTLDSNAKFRYDKEQEEAKAKLEKEAEKRDAFATIEDTMRAYGFTAAEMIELSDYIQKAIIDPNLGPNGAILGMKQIGRASCRERV
jgi:hypothetical protein